MTMVNEREVVITEIDGVDPSDYPDFCDAYIADAYWKDTGKVLTDEEIDMLNNLFPDIAAEMAFDKCIGFSE